MQHKQLLITGVSLLFCTHFAFSYGIRVDDKDALATARGNAFVATADNASAVYYNPAGITQIQSPTIMAGSYGLIFDVDYENLQGDTFSNDSSFQLAPFLHAVVPFRNKAWTLGFSAHAPFGLENNWPEGTTFDTIATRSSFRYYRLSPVVAWEISPTWSVAGGLHFDRGEADLRRLHPQPGVGEIRLEGSDDTLGYVLALHWRPSPRHTFGAVYRSRTTFDLSGDMTIGGTRIPAEAEFPFPEIVVVGYAFRPNRQWNFEFNLDWTNWDVLDKVTIVTADGTQTDMPFEWKSSLIYKFGATRYLRNNYRLSGGYMFSENSVPSQHFSPSVPDADRHIFSLGLGRSYRTLDWDIAYQFGYSPTREIRGSEPPLGSPQTADGDYDSHVHGISATIAFRF